MRFAITVGFVGSLLLATGVVGQTPATPSPEGKEAWGQNTVQEYLLSYRTLKTDPLALKRALEETGLSMTSFEMPGCEDVVPDEDHQNRRHQDEVTQYPLKQFPFIRVREYSGEKLVEWFKTPNGKLWADRRSIIRVCIDASELVNEGIFSQGDLSLSAQLGDRAVSVDGYAEIGKNFEKFKPAALRPERFVVNYATINASRTNGGTPIATVAERASVISDILAGMVSTSQGMYAITRITDRSEEDIKSRAKALKDAITRYRTVATDVQSNADQVGTAIDEKNAAIAAIAKEILAAVTEEADLAANPNADAKKKEAARSRTNELSAVHAQRRAELRALQARRGNIESKATVVPETEVQLREAVAQVGALFALSAPAANARIIKFTSSLRPGQIFLRKEDAKRGDVLRIMLLHFAPDFKTDGTAASAVPLTQTLAEIHIDEFGWKNEVVDSFLLVKANDPEAKSNFSGAAGASLLWSPQPRARRDTPFLSTIRSLSPSIGANVSYLDFDPDREIEIGAGVIASLFENQIHFGYGWNLNYGGDRGYWFLGFSFGKIQDRLTGDDD